MALDTMALDTMALDTRAQVTMAQDTMEGSTTMRIACVGGGPGGLFFATLVKSAHPEWEVTLYERNRADDTFGFGVVFSDATLAGIFDADPVLRTALKEHGVRWDRIEVRLKGERYGCAGNGMTAVVRKTLLSLLQQRAADVGVELRFETDVDLADVADHDLVVAADGANSRIREQLAEQVRPSVETASAKFIWFGTSYLFDGLTFVHVRGPHGVFAVHGYPISPEMSTFIVETDEETWRRAGLDEFDVEQPPGPSDQKTRAYLEELFAGEIDGHPLLVNNSRWGNFRTRRAATWHHGNVALLGDSAHTAHFSVGSGTKMAMEDAIVLAAALDEHPDDVPGALKAYEAGARPAVDRIQGSARPSLSWWEHFGRYYDALEPWQFSVHFLTRSISAERLGRRDPAYVAAMRSAWRERRGADVLESPLSVAGTSFPGRIVDVAGRGDQRYAAAPGDSQRLALLETPAGERPAGEAPWALVVRAPDDESGLPAALDRLRSGLAGGPSLVAVEGGSRLARVLVSEECRLGHGVPTVLVEAAVDADDAETLVLSGRADVVGVDKEVRA